MAPMSRSARPGVSLANLDLNLLVSLDALLQERSVTRAAARLRLSQPTVSGTLARLRRHFGDELLVRAGNRYDLTPLAADLLARTAGALTMVEEVFAGRADSDAGSGQREFRVIASDFGVAVLGPAVSRILRERGRPVSLRFERIGEEVIT